MDNCCLVVVHGYFHICDVHLIHLFAIHLLPWATGQPRWNVLRNKPYILISTIDSGTGVETLGPVMRLSIAVIG